MIRKTTPEDSIDIWMWRNDEKTREMAIEQKIVTWESHQDWFERTLLNSNRHMYIGCTEKGEKIGICRFDIDFEKDMAEVSINLNPVMRNKKLSYPFLRESMTVFCSEYKLNLVAKIKKNNIASQRCFEKAGFILQEEGGELRWYLLRHRF